MAKTLLTRYFNVPTVNHTPTLNAIMQESISDVTMTAPTGILSLDWTKLRGLEKKLKAWIERESEGSLQWEGDFPISYTKDRYGEYTIRNARVPNLEAKYIKQADSLASKYGYKVYHQTDPRGAALYIYKQEDLLKQNFPIDCCYSDIGIACV